MPWDSPSFVVLGSFPRGDDKQVSVQRAAHESGRVATSRSVERKNDLLPFLGNASVWIRALLELSPRQPAIGRSDPLPEPVPAERSFTSRLQRSFERVTE